MLVLVPIRTRVVLDHLLVGSSETLICALCSRRLFGGWRGIDLSRIELSVLLLLKSRLRVFHHHDCRGRRTHQVLILLWLRVLGRQIRVGDWLQVKEMS